MIYYKILNKMIPGFRLPVERRKNGGKDENLIEVKFES